MIFQKRPQTRLQQIEGWLFELAQKLVAPQGILMWGLLGAIALSLIASTGIVYSLGGTRLPYVHVIYLPIVLGGLSFGVRGGLLTGLLAGLLLGPLMPESVLNQEYQPLSSWLVRLGFFMAIGGSAGLGSEVLRAYLRNIHERYFMDPVTGLPNVSGLREHFLTLPPQQSVAFIIMQLDHLDEIDGAVGPLGTMRVLRRIGMRLQTALRKDEEDMLNESSESRGFVCQINSTSFGILVYDPAHTLEVIKLCRKDVMGSFFINEVPLFIEASYGIAKIPEDEENLSGILRKARLALDRGRKEGKTVTFADPNEVDLNEKNLALLHDLSEAIERNELSLVFQPKMDLKTQKVCGLETLIRWKHPVHGMVSPGVFIPLAERTLLIHPLTRWVVRTALTQFRKWREQGEKIKFAINVSMKNFGEEDFLSFFLAMREEFELESGDIELEVTESSIGPNMEQVIESIRILRAFGYQVAIDDFGTGQASLRYLYDLPVDVIKIDKSFVDHIGQSKEADAIVQSCIVMGHKLGHKVVAEGIEKKEQMALLSKWGCDIGQGYYYSPPLPSPAFWEWYKVDTHVQQDSEKPRLDF